MSLETEEGEKEKIEVEDGGEVVDSEDDKRNEEEDEMEKGDMEDEDVPVVSDSNKDDSVSEGDVSNRNNHLLLKLMLAC